MMQYSSQNVASQQEITTLLERFGLLIWYHIRLVRSRRVSLSHEYKEVCR
jgi:hypothetical protein